MKLKNTVEPRVIPKNAPIYGLKSVPRTAEPSMFQILNWRNENFDETRKIMASLNKTATNKRTKENQSKEFESRYMTEAQYNYRPYVVADVEKTVEQPEEEQKKEIVICVQEKEGEPVYLRFDSEAALNEYLGNIEQKRQENEKRNEENQKQQAEKAKVKRRPKTSKKKIFPPNPDKEEINRIKKFNEQTRWLPNSAFQTYYGKPAFENYGMGNTHPIWGGLGYGDYLKSFNINPQRGDNKPAYDQVFKSTAYASFKVDYEKDHIPKKCKEEYRLSDQALNHQKSRLKLLPEKKEVMSLGKLEKPDLTQTAMFRSKNYELKDVESEEKENQVIEEIKHLKKSNKRLGQQSESINSQKPNEFIMSEKLQTKDNRHTSNTNGRMHDTNVRSVYNPGKYTEFEPNSANENLYNSKVVKFVRS